MPLRLPYAISPQYHCLSSLSATMVTTLWLTQPTCFCSDDDAMLRKCSDSVRSTPLFSAFFFENSLLGMHFGLLLQLVTCSFISMEGELTQNQGFLRLSEKCRDVLPLEHSVLDDH